MEGLTLCLFCYLLIEFVKLLSVAGKKFNNDPTKVLSTQGAEIDDVSLVRENEHLYIINEHQLRSEPQGKCFHSIKHNIFMYKDWRFALGDSHLFRARRNHMILCMPAEWLGGIVNLQCAMRSI